MPGEPRVSVILPSYNGAPVLARHLPAVVRQARDLPGGAEVLVVDDASPLFREETAAAVAAAGPPARLVPRANWGGFSATCNAGAAVARGHLLLFLNIDMHPGDGMLETLVARLEGDPGLFGVTPVIENRAGGFPESSTRARWRRGGFDLVFPGRRGIPAPGPGETRGLAYGCGGALLCRADRFRAIGGFAEIFGPFYWEDADLGWQALREGWLTLEIGDTRAYHDHQATIGAHFSPAEVRATYERNRLFFTWVHGAGTGALLEHVAWLPVRWLAALLRGGPAARGIPAALRRLPEAFALRRGRAGTLPAARRLLRAVRRSGAAGWAPPLAGSPSIV